MISRTPPTAIRRSSLQSYRPVRNFGFQRHPQRSLTTTAFSLRIQLQTSVPTVVYTGSARGTTPTALPTPSEILSSRQLVRSLSTTMSTNGEARPKRRTSPVSALERPKKQLKQENGVPTPGDGTPLNGSVYDVEGDITSVPIVNTVSAAGDSPEWQATIERVIKSVVSIHFCQTCSFDTDLSTSSQATGFVVDADRGYILTNRHVVCSGPFWGYCVFDNHEEVGDLHHSASHSTDFGSAMCDLSIAIRCMISAFSSLTPRPSSTCRSKT